MERLLQFLRNWNGELRYDKSRNGFELTVGVKHFYFSNEALGNSQEDFILAVINRFEQWLKDS